MTVKAKKTYLPHSTDSGYVCPTANFPPQSSEWHRGIDTDAARVGGKGNQLVIMAVTADWEITSDTLPPNKSEEVCTQRSLRVRGVRHKKAWGLIWRRARKQGVCGRLSFRFDL